MVVLSAIEVRVLGALMEKEMTTPEYYPLSLNAAVNACNQKSSRDPVMELGEADVRTALYELEQMGLAKTVQDTRVSKFEHRTRDVLNLRRDETAVVCLLLLRGAQTPAELRMRAERMFSFDDNAAVLATLERLAAREEPMTVLMQRQPGAREARWMHLLGGAVDTGVVERLVGRAAADDVSPGMEAKFRELEALVHSLSQRLQALEDSRHASGVTDEVDR